MTNDQTPTPRDAGNWAQRVDRLHVGETAPGARTGNVEGRRLTSPLNGFGKLWQKTYRVNLGEVTPETAIRTWKDHYGDFWPSYNRFYAPIAGIKPGEIAMIGGGVGPVKLSTGVMVIYADDTSFAYMTPEGHPFAGMITFSAQNEDQGTVAQVQLLIRSNDPLYELGFMMGARRVEDRIWQHTLRALAAHFGSTAQVEKNIVCVDRRREWKNFRNIKYNTVFGPFRSRRRQKST